MSEIASKLNGLVLIIIAAAGLFMLTKHFQIGPPDDTWFQSEVINQPGPVLVKFGASWCPPCRMLEGELDQFAKDVQGRVTVVRVDVDQHRALAQHYRVSSIPRLLLFNHGQIVADRVGFADHQQLESWALSHAPAKPVTIQGVQAQATPVQRPRTVATMR